MNIRLTPPTLKSKAFETDPYPLYRRLRDTMPIAYDEPAAPGCIPAGRPPSLDRVTTRHPVPGHGTDRRPRHDAVHDDLPPDMFGLVHARLLLCHLPQREDVLRRAAR